MGRIETNLASELQAIVNAERHLAEVPHPDPLTPTTQHPESEEHQKSKSD